MVVRCDVVLGEPRFVCREDRRDEDAPRLENLSVAAYRLWTVDEIEDRVDTVRIGLPQRVDDIGGVAVIDILGAETAGLFDVAANGRDDVRATGERHLHRRACSTAGC